MARERRIVEREVGSVERKRGWLSKATWLLMALLLALSAGGLTGVLASYYLNNSRYSVEVSALATYRPPQVTTIYADDGETVLAEFAIEKRIPIKEQDIPKNVEDALLAIEDYRYYDHIGIDPYRIAGVIVKNITTGKLEGASTITQQLAKNLYLSEDRNFLRKGREAVYTYFLERELSKKRILEIYLNSIEWGDGVYGAEAAARTYFRKSASNLTREEAAFLAAMIPSPLNVFNPQKNRKRVNRRQRVLLKYMNGVKLSY